MEFADDAGDSALSLQNREIYSELAKKTKKLERLKEKVMHLFFFFFPCGGGRPTETLKLWATLLPCFW